MIQEFRKEWNRMALISQNFLRQGEISKVVVVLQSLEQLKRFMIELDKKYI